MGSDLLAAAQAGDGEAFGLLVGPLRAELLGYGYRMLGSPHDAEDVVQDTLDRAWRSLDRLENPGSIRPWLFKIATNRALTLIERRGRRELPTGLGPEQASGGEVRWLQPYPDRLMASMAALDPQARVVARESMELAFVITLQHLSAPLRAALLLRRVLGYSAAETAELLGTTVAAVNSALQRARKVLTDRMPEGSQQHTLDALGETGQRQLARQYATAWENGDVEAIVAMLTADARYSMPPLLAWYQGRDAIHPGLPARHGRQAPVALPSGACEQATGVRHIPMGRRWRVYLPSGLALVMLRGRQVAEVVSFLDADLPTFELPAQLSGPR